MLDALKAYLETKGYHNIYIDRMPAWNYQLEAIALFCWNHSVGQINDGTGVRYIQIQVRRDSYGEARQVCDDIFRLLDSGTGETVLNLTKKRSCIARPRRGPLKMEGNENYTTFYCEIALWGEN